MRMTLDRLADCFAHVIIDYHNTILSKREKGALNSSIKDVDSLLRQKDAYDRLKAASLKVTRIYNNREEHLALCLILFKELKLFDSSIDAYVKDLIELKKSHNESDLLSKQARFISDCKRLKLDMTRILTDLYRLNHDGITIDFNVRTQRDGVKTFKLSSTTKSFSTLGYLPDFGQSLRAKLLVQLELSEIPSYKTPEDVATEKMQSIFTAVVQKIESLVEQEWEEDPKEETHSPASSANEYSPAQDDKMSLIALVTRGHMISLVNEKKQKKESDTKQNEATGWGFTSVFSLAKW